MFFLVLVGLILDMLGKRFTAAAAVRLSQSAKLAGAEQRVLTSWTRLRFSSGVPK